MPRFSTDAIILNVIDYSESDRIVSALTRDHGIISAIAKGARNSKRRFPGTLEPFSDITMDLFLKPGLDLFRLEAATLNTANLGIREDLDIFAHAAVLMEIIKEHLGSLDPSPMTYDSLSRSLRLMNRDSQWFSVWAIGMVKILTSLGYGIDLEEWADHHKLPTGLSMESMMFMLKGLALEPEVLTKLSVSRAGRIEIAHYLIETCRKISERPLKSIEFVAKLLDDA